ncbi:MAG TPA: hypothetical protein VGI97_03785, partial [Gemmatimonadaceae bacterium]
MWGVVLTVGALLYPESQTPVVIVALSIASFTYGGLLGAFLLGIYNARARQRDVILGMAVGITVMAAVVFAKPLGVAFPSVASTLGPFANIAWPWYVLIGTTITLFVGTVSALRNPILRLP